MSHERVIRRRPPEGGTPPDKWSPPVDPEWDKRFKKAMLYVKSPGVDLNRQSRYDLAKMIPGVDSDGEGSWKDLTTSQLDDLLNMLEGFIFIKHLKNEQEGQQ
jgi:hypothetical protein